MMRILVARSWSYGEAGDTVTVRLSGMAPVIAAFDMDDIWLDVATVLEGQLPGDVSAECLAEHIYQQFARRFNCGTRLEGRWVESVQVSAGPGTYVEVRG